MELKFSQLNGTPVFSIHERVPALDRVHGSVFDETAGIWYFPAYAPFGSLVASDLKKVAPGLTFSPEAAAQLSYLTTIPDRLARREHPPLTFLTKPFEHQVEALSFVWHHPRSALFFDPGTGKTKIAIDMIRLEPHKKVLVLTPKVTVLNWLEQLKLHSGDELSATAIVGTPEKKRKIIMESSKYQVLVTSYGTARNYGLPKVFPPGIKLLKAGVQSKALSASGAQILGRVVRAVSDPSDQVGFIQIRIDGRTMPEVEKAVADYIAENGPQWLEDVDYTTIISDESHCIKDMRSQQTKAVLGLSKKASRRLIMSGTPTMGNPLHLYPQMKFLSPAIIPEDWMRFSDKFLVRAKWNKRIVTGFQNLNILNARVQRIAINKTKDECLDLPPRTIIDVPVELSPEQTRLYNTLVQQMGIDLDGFFEATPASRLEVQNAAVLLNKLAQVASGFVINNAAKEICNGCPHLLNCVGASILPYTPACKVEQKAVRDIKYTKENPKLEALSDLLDTILENPKNKVIVWGVYHAELDAIEELLKKKLSGSETWVRVDGRTGSKIQNHINTFNNDPNCRVYVGQVATGVGITLNAATYMIYYTLDWSLGTYLQSIDRNYRAGQTQKTTVYRLLGRGTVDEYKAIALDEKKDIGAVLTSKLTCVACPKKIECLKAGIEIFDKGCIHKRSARRTVAHAEEIK